MLRARERLVIIFRVMVRYGTAVKITIFIGKRVFGKLW